ncbi:MAG: hypothetical protein LCH95_00035 [Proteobacteria bacterium]|nr:hypothetical protein [Pseudomonadota bacterium]
MDGQTIFKALANSLLDELKDTDLDCGSAGYLGTAFETTFNEPPEDEDELVRLVIANSLRSAYKSANMTLNLDEVQLNWFDGTDFKYGNPCGYVRLTFRQRTFEEELFDQLNLRLDEPTRVTWEYRDETTFNPQLDLPYMHDLDLADLEVYHSVFRETWAGSLTWAKLQGSSSLFAWS